MARQDLEHIAETIASAVEGIRHNSRIQHGMKLRAQMHAAIAAGQPFDHYRLPWLSNAIDETVEFAKGLCSKFDEAHPDDCASILDLIDILRSAANMVEQSLQSNGQS